jgi:Xaa-Pro aminopeptidase
LNPLNEICLMSSSPPRLIYAASEQCADLLYATGFSAPDAFLWFQIDDETYVVVSTLEYGRAAKTVKPGIVVLTPRQALEQFGGQFEKDMPSTADIIENVTRNRTVKEWGVPSSFPLGMAERLDRRGIRLRVETPFFASRKCKMADEIVHVREGVELASKGMLAGLKLLRESIADADGVLVWRDDVLTSEQVRGEIDAAIMRSGGLPQNTIVAGGVQGADPHEMGHGALRASEPIVIDVFPRASRTGYFGDLTRTVVKGEVPEVVRRAYEAVAAAQDAATEMIFPGVPCREVHEKAAAVLRAHGFQTGQGDSAPYGFIHGLGHGLGLEIHEAPHLSPRSDETLEPGMVITIEPGLYYPEWGGVRLENVVAVTEFGGDHLTSIPRDLLV